MSNTETLGLQVRSATILNFLIRPVSNETQKSTFLQSGPLPCKLTYKGQKKLSSLGILWMFFSGLNGKLTAGQQIILSMNNENHFIVSLKAFICRRLFILWFDKAFLTLSTKRGGQGQNNLCRWTWIIKFCIGLRSGVCPIQSSSSWLGNYHYQPMWVVKILTGGLYRGSAEEPINTDSFSVRCENVTATHITGLCRLLAVNS